MSEDPKKALETKEEEEVVETPEEEVVQLSPLEEEAKSQGWLPKEEWEAAGNDPDEWRSAKEFKDRGELYKSIHTAKRELQQTKQALTALQRHHKHVFEQAHNKAVKELKKARREALRDGEVERVDEIEQDLEVLENEHKEAAKEFEQAPAVQTGVHPSFEAWLPANRWYEKDAELRDYADFVGLKYSKDHPGVSPEEVLKHVSQRVKNQFPDKFGARRAAPSPTGAPTKKTTSSKSAGMSNDEIEALGGNVEIMNTLIKSGTLTKEQYVKDLEQINKRKG